MINQQKPLHPAVAIAVLAVVVIAFVSLLFFVAGQLLQPHDPAPRPFVAQAWQSNEDQRFAMLGDLEHRYKLIGMSEQELYRLLGKPDWAMSDYNWISYDLGAVGKDSETRFGIHFNNGRVDKFELRRDT